MSQKMMLLAAVLALNSCKTRDPRSPGLLTPAAMPPAPFHLTCQPAQETPLRFFIAAQPAETGGGDEVDSDSAWLVSVTVERGDASETVVTGEEGRGNLVLGEPLSLSFPSGAFTGEKMADGDGYNGILTLPRAEADAMAVTCAPQAS